MICVDNLYICILGDTLLMKRDIRSMYDMDTITRYITDIGHNVLQYDDIHIHVQYSNTAQQLHDDLKYLHIFLVYVPIMESIVGKVKLVYPCTQLRVDIVHIHVYQLFDFVGCDQTSIEYNYLQALSHRYNLVSMKVTHPLVDVLHSYTGILNNIVSTSFNVRRFPSKYIVPVQRKAEIMYLSSNMRSQFMQKRLCVKHLYTVFNGVLPLDCMNRIQQYIISVIYIKWRS